MTLHPAISEVTARIVERSRDRRAAYLEQLEAAAADSPARGKLSCANWAHAFAAEPAEVKLRALDPRTPNIGIVSAYNDMLSAHQPLERFPALIKAAAREAGATAQFAGGVPAMCDGVTQGRPGMELSLFSRDVIAMATAVALTHDAFDAGLYLGVCDKIVPGLLIGALAFPHLPAIFVPAGPMTSGLSNVEKAKVRALYAEGKVGRDRLLEAEQAGYHGPGTCTFYGTADVNHFHAAGGMAFVVRELMKAGLVHADVLTVAGEGLSHYAEEPFLDGDTLAWREGRETSLDTAILRPVSDPFDREGGIRLLRGGLGRAVIKASACKPEDRKVTAPAVVFDSQDAFLAAFKRGDLDRDFIAVIRFQGPGANGMPELHSLSPSLGVLLDRGFKVALVTDGRMSGASGKTPAAIHVTPEAAKGGALAHVRDGDLITLDADAGVLDIHVSEAELRSRPAAPQPPSGPGYGRDLFANMRAAVGPADRGASALY